jgi:hypothetical protein
LKNKSGNAMWECICDCGTLVVVPTSNLRSGNSTSCGCYAKEVLSKASIKNLLGMQFDRLTVVADGGRTSNGQMRWKCLCSCGKTKVVNSQNLITRNTRSCGCLHKEWTKILGKLNKQDNPISSTPEYKRAKQKEWLKNPLVLLTRRIRWGMWNAMQDLGVEKKRKTFEMLGYPSSELVAHIERQFLPGMSWANQGDWHIDHIVPVSSATSLEEIIALNQLSNLRPLWGEENKKKGAKRTHLI